MTDSLYMSRSVSIRRTIAASLALAVSAFGVTAAVVPALAPALAGGVADGPRAVAGHSGADAAFKRIGLVRRSTSTTGAARTTDAAPGSTSYTFSTVLDGQPVRWDPCTPIRWTANVAGAPAGALEVLGEAVARVAQVTGTRWEYVGPSTATATSAYLPTRSQATYPPVLLGWTDGASSDLLAGQAASVLGMTRTAWFGIQRPDGSKVAATRAAVIAFDRTDTLPLRGATSWKALALHELGHVMGLGHVGDRTQLMASVLPPVSDLQAGDQAGLVKVGRTAGCVVVQ